MSDTQKSEKKPAEKKKVSLRYKRDQEREKVKGMFKFYEVPGGTLSFVYKKYAGDKVEKFTLKDGKVYQIPLGVARHLNQNGWYPEHEYLTDADGKPIMRVKEKVRRFGFQSLEFTDIEGLDEPSNLVTVDRIG